MDVRHLILLRELSTRGTLAAVAAATHRTPSAISQQLRTAEREIGIPLVEPHSRSVRLTVAGQILAEGADEVTMALARVEARLQDSLGQPGGEVSIQSLPSAGTLLLPDLLTALAPSAITLRLSDIDVPEADFVAQALDHDIIIAHSLDQDAYAQVPGLSVNPLATEPIDVALPADHPLAQRSTLRAADLFPFDWIAVPQGYPFDSILIAAENLCGATLRRRYRVRDNQLVASLVRAGHGLALLPRYSTATGASMVLRPLTDVRAERHVLALSRADRAARRAVRTVVAELARIGTRLAGRNRSQSSTELD